MSSPADTPAGRGGPPSDEPSAAAARRRMSIENRSTGFRRVPNAGQIARRRLLLRWTKWVLPAGALLLLASIAAWPEIDRAMNSARIGVRQASQIRVDSGRMLGARYRGLDGRDRPYMITADEAQQVSPPPAAAARPDPASADPASADLKPHKAAAATPDDRINLTHPIADTLNQSGSWVRISARDGVYMQHSQFLDLSHDVLLYRDDGIMMTGPVADLDLRRGVIASNDWVHAEGPFGVLDAQGYLISQRDGLAQFRGPSRMVLNDDRIARPSSGPADAPASAPVSGAAAPSAQPVGTAR